ncbi:MAG TPA: right-handed parallel beta-helix repeat-containing protein [Jatrophihabitans sp.]|nr:right-handed parallel beta-helix repeat-containing protein [Jatrophihabitans sp.]
MSRRLARPAALICVYTVLAGATVGALLTTASAEAAAQPDTAAYAATRNIADWFGRTVPHGLGVASVGGPWSTSSRAQFAVTPGHGKVGILDPGTSAVARLGAVVCRDERVRLRFSVPRLPTSGNGTFVSLQLRRQRSGAEYLARVRVAPGGRLMLSLLENQDGRQRTLAPEIAVAQRATAGRQVVLEGRVTRAGAPSLAARAWLADTAVPDWQRVAVDTTSVISTAGTYGVDTYQSGASGSGRIDARAFQGWALTGTAEPSTSSSAPASATASPSASATPTPSPTTTSPPPPPPSPSPPPTVGAPALGSTDYPIPADAVYAAPVGSDIAGTGTAAAPYRTLAKAVAAAPSDGTVVLRAGIYNEHVFLSKPLTIQNAPGQAVWLDGSVPVTDWTQTGSTWMHSGWTYQFDSSASFTKGSDAGGFVNPNYPMAAHPDQVFMDGHGLTQVASNPGPGEFAVDYAAQQITLGSDPTGHAIRASNIQQAVVASAGNVTLRGIGIRRYATSLWQMGTVFLGGSIGGDVLRDLAVQDNATQGVSADTPNVTIDHLTSSGNGMTGIHANAADGLIVQNSVIDANNAEHFNVQPAAAAIKVTRVRGLTIRDNVVSNTRGATGIWTDVTTVGFAIVGNKVLGNPVYGIETELSDTGIVADNVISGAKYGYTAYNTGNVQVYNNTLDDNGVWDVGMTMDARRNLSDPTCPWISRNIVFSDNLFGRDGSLGSGMFQFYALDKATHTSADAMNVTVDGNVFNTKSVTRDPTLVGWGGSDNVTVASYNALATFDSMNGWSNSAQPATDALAAPVGAYDGTGVAIPLPGDVARAIGVATGAAHIGAF